MYPAEEDAADTQVCGDLLLGKVLKLEERFNAAALDYVGIQEGRSRRCETRAGLHYDMFVGKASAIGGGGCHIWVRRSQRFRLGEFINPNEHIAVVTGTLGKSGLPAIFVCAHAPTAAAVGDVRDAFVGVDVVA